MKHTSRVGAGFRRLVPLLRTPLLGLALMGASASVRAEDRGQHARRVLLLSVDGLHSLDLANYVASHPNSTLARLARNGVTYTSASTSKPSDSYPGILSMATGGSPVSTGVYYDDSYDRLLAAPGSDGSVRGTEVVYDETVDVDLDSLDGGGGIDPAKLPIDPSHGNKPVYPHQFLRVNTIFEVAKAGGLRTAWSDKHPSYEILNGPSGKGLDDLFAPEINSAANFTASVALCEGYDDIKVAALLHEIDGFDHTGMKRVGTPSLFGMNFQAVSVGEKTVSYEDGSGAPTPGLADALDHTDRSIGMMVDELEKRDLLGSTTIILTAKHGQSPIDLSQRLIVSSKIIPNLINSIEPGLAAQVTADDVALIWLQDQSKTEIVAQTLRDNKATAQISEVFAGEGVKNFFPDPLKDSRSPDIVVVPNQGVIYTSPTATKTAEHGGFAHDDVNVALVVSRPGMRSSTIKTPVQTTQIAPTILDLLGLDPDALEAVRIEKTTALPGLDLSDR
jgi:hypothetical protein